MTAQETNTANGAESTLSSSLSSGATTINVTSTAAFPSVPFYAVIDPDVDASREVILVDSSKTATTFVLSAASKRGQDGTTDTSHSSGAKVVCVPVAALWTDINDRVDVKANDADVVKLTGNQTIAGAKTFSTDPTLADGSSALSATEAAAAYEPLGGSSRMFTAGDLESVRGTPARGNPNVTWSYWLLDSATQEAVGAVLHIPTGWSTVDIDVWWVNAGAGAGDVVLGYRRDSPGEGGALGTGAASGSATVTASAQNIVKKTTVGTGVSVSSLSLAGIAVERNGSAGADTLGNDIGVLAVVIRKAS